MVAARQCSGIPSHVYISQRLHIFSRKFKNEQVYWKSKIIVKPIEYLDEVPPMVLELVNLTLFVTEFYMQIQIHK